MEPYIHDSTRFGISGKYYFSPKLSLSGLVSYSFSFQREKEDDLENNIIYMLIELAPVLVWTRL